ncbi:two-component system sensor histidine kinase GlrK [Variovorax paradoxus]|uniref:histidine kinase n=1 Tax=Variovorax paradoxus TaxID=34073 RepID=A0AAE3XSL5_VARPD|nr:MULTISPECIES: ATP-binding protein [Variovorax]MBD9663901.1 two-component sensor histidine kinase [Variovorax sp. VRV01]MDP9966292.1 two-component system sensor histidine kinase GlrK [Variovorax paradoxus]MDR6424164.1 two-component system sensor histidine kinase GlrK [Variovorax paradoxus]MDR6452562.1 two-component system sensor histidine kinase GlrK [Variovorax paradoxus]
MAKRPSRRGSFQQLLLFAFLLITALLVGVALRSVFQYDALMTQSRDAAARALRLSGAAQSLAERSAAMERAGRQSLVLNDAVLRRRFDDAAREAHQVLERLERNGLAPSGIELWRAQLGVIEGLMSGSAESALSRESGMAMQFRELDSLNTNLAQQAQFLIEMQNDALAKRIENARRRLMREVVAASILAVSLALAFGIWLARPFKRLEHAIVGLGQNRLDEPIDIRGPADVRRLSQQLEWLRLRLTELDADKARFLRHVSHELKTPLAALREGVSLLEDGVTGPLNPAQLEVAQILNQNTVSLQGQIEALLRFNAAAFEARELRRERTDLLPLVEEQIEAQRLQWQAHGLRVHAEGESITLPVDRAKLGTAVANLLSNAIRYSARGGVISIVVSGTPTTACIDINDAGPGIAEGDRDRIFEPFYRGERQPEHAVKGTGIGLSIVQEYIAAHGGRITLLPEGPGARFRIELPRTA